MNPIQKFLFAFAFALTMTSVCVSQTMQAAKAETSAKPLVRFVDTDGKAVTPETSLYFGGGRATPIVVENGIGKLPTTTRLVVAKAAGFQYSGAVVRGDETEVVFYRDDEPCPALKQSAYPLTDELKSKVVETIKENLWGKVKDQPPSSMNTIQTVRVLAGVDPTGAFKWLDESDLPEQMAGMVAQTAMAAMVREDPEEAFDRCSQVEKPMFRSSMLMFLLNALPPDDPAAKAVEEQLLESTRAVHQASLRLAMQSSLAEHYVLTNRPDISDKIVQQHIEEVKKLPSAGWSAYPRSLFAALVVEKDPELAQQLLEGNRDQNESNRAHARVAFSCCRTNPELAIKLLSLREIPENTITVWAKPIQVCHRMALEQTEAARKLAASIDESNQRAWALGLMASRLNDSDPETAKALLNEAVNLLGQPEARDQQWLPNGGTLAGLLPIAQEIEPAKVRPMIWQAVFETLPRSRWAKGTSNRVKTQSVAGAIARFDLELGRAMVGSSNIDAGNMFAESAARQALLNPDGLVEYTERICGLDSVRSNRLFDKITDLVTQSESGFWKSISKPEMLYWPTKKFEEL